MENLLDFLPINCNWFFLLIGGGFLLSAFLWVACAMQVESVPGDSLPRRNKLNTLFFCFLGILSSLLTLYFLVWCIYANNQPLEIDTEEMLEVKPVIYPDGRTVQMFNSNGVNHNANTMFSSMIPEGSKVRKVNYKRTYAGVYFPPTGGRGRDAFPPSYYLVHPDKTEKRRTGFGRTNNKTWSLYTA